MVIFGCQTIKDRLVCVQYVVFKKAGKCPKYFSKKKCAVEIIKPLPIKYISVCNY